MAIILVLQRFGLRSRWRPVWMAGAILGACRHPPTAPQWVPQFDLHVPFIAQTEANDCGAVALAMTMQFNEHYPDIDALRQELTIPALGGTIPALIVAAADDRGFDTDLSDGNPDILSESLRNNIPLIVLLGPAVADSGGPGHFVVVTGMAHHGAAIRVHDGLHENHWMQASDFMQRWAVTGHLGIRLSPRVPSQDGERHSMTTTLETP